MRKNQKKIFIVLSEILHGIVIDIVVIFLFIPMHSYDGGRKELESVSIENTIWSNTVIASGTVTGLVLYTGRETRSVMNTSVPATKVGLIDLEINMLSKILFVLLMVLSLIMTALKGFKGIWYIYYFRFLLLFSAIIPISMRVNLDLGKTVYSWLMMRDKVRAYKIRFSFYVYAY